VNKFEPGNESDDSEYVDCENMFDQSSGCSDPNSDELDVASAARYNHNHRLEQCSSLNRSMNLAVSVDTKLFPKLTSKHKLSANYIINKLRLNNENISQRLSSVTRPKYSTNSLTKLLSFRKRLLNDPLTSQNQQIVCIHSTDDLESGQARQASNVSPSKTMSDNATLVFQQRSGINSSGSTETVPSISDPMTSTSTTATTIRRRDKSQSVSLDDTLSIIEEKLDDEDHPFQPAAQPRSRLHSSSSVKCRQIVRSKEIELNDDSGVYKFARYKSSSISSADDENYSDFLDANVAAPPTPAYYDKSADQHEQILAPSMACSPSASDETIKAENSSCRSKLTTQLSTPIPHKPVATLRRSDTDIPRSQDGPYVQGASSDILTNSSPIRTKVQMEGKRASPDSSYSSHKSHCNGHNFVQSVRVIKAQQHLLQNMIRHQNQNLLISSQNKSKNAFMFPNRVHESEYPFVTIKRYPENMIECTGGVVSVHSVKLLDHIINDEESETRDIWWTEIRKEIRSHAKALNCNTILGYSETSKVLGDVCMLSASGTAAVLRPPKQESMQPDNRSGAREPQLAGSSHLQTLKVPRLSHSPPLTHSTMPTLVEPAEFKGLADREPREEGEECFQQGQGEAKKGGDFEGIDCSFCHTPLKCVDSITNLANCSICKTRKVPDILLLTIEPPHNLNIASAGFLVQARVCRAKRDSHGEASAKEIGDALPFLEYELHRQLISKLKFKGMNCLFNLCIDVSVGENMLTGIATGTGCFVLGLPTPEPPRISAGKGIKTSKLTEIQRLIAISSMKNREMLGLKQIDEQLSLYHDRIGLSSPADCHNQAEMERKVGSISNDNNCDVNSQAPDMSGQPNKGAEFSGQGGGTALTRPKVRPDERQRSRASRFQNQEGKKFARSEGQDSLVATKNLVDLLADENNIVLEVDDNEDADIIALLIDSDVPDGYLICNSESVPTLRQSVVVSINMFTQVMRAKLSGTDQFAQQFDRILQTLFVKLRRSLPCCLSNVNFVVDLPESHIVQISITGCLLGLSGSLDSTEGCGEQAIKADDGTIRQPPVADSKLARSSSTSASISTSSTSSSSTASPSSSTSTLASSSSSIRSIKEVTREKAAATSKSVETKSLSLQISKSNIAALLSGRSSFGESPERRKGAKEGAIELREGGRVGGLATGSTKVAIAAAVKQETPKGRLWTNQPPSIRFMRPVFKKQQTYPGATSPQISGQDKLLPTSGGSSGATFIGGGSSSNAANRATLILNKVKQPLKDLGSNFNTTINQHSGDSGASKLARVSNFSRASSSSTTCRSRGQVQASSSTSFMGERSDANQPARAELIASQTAPKTSSERTLNSSIDITSLSYIPGAKEYHYLGNLSFSFVRETNSVRENGGLNGFIHCFLMEVYAIVRAHVSALGGNAFVSFRLQQSCIFYHSNKNQAQCLISVAGDAVQVSL